MCKAYISTTNKRYKQTLQLTDEFLIEINDIALCMQDYKNEGLNHTLKTQDHLTQ